MASSSYLFFIFEKKKKDEDLTLKYFINFVFGGGSNIYHWQKLKSFEIITKLNQNQKS